jgi:hypothetical protein
MTVKINREKIRAKFGGLCAYTGKPLGDDWEIDHIEPLRNVRVTHTLTAEQAFSDNNLVLCLKIVNHYKRSLGLEGFRKYMETIHIRLRNMRKKDGTFRTNITDSRYKYVARVAEAFGITQDNPFDGTFFFERFRKEQH